jgi:hypothetical protein
MDTRYTEFLSGMGTVYDRFRGNPPNIDGTQVGGIVTKNHELYAIVLRHSNKVNDAVARMSEKISQITSSLIYTTETIHTTVLDTVPDGEIDGSLERSFDTLWWVFFPSLSLTFSSPLSNKDSIILPGTPSESFIGLSDELHRSISRSNPISWSRLKKPWWAHITIGRYLTHASSDTWIEIMKLLETFPELWECKPVSLEVWKCRIWPSGFHQTTLAEKKL